MRKTGSALQTRLFPEPGRNQPEPEPGRRYTRGQVSIHFDRAENLYADWPAPTCIISDGPQKPLKLIDRIIRASTERGDVVWEPFGGLCPGAVVSRHLGRKYHAAEPIPEFYAAATERLKQSAFPR